MAKRINHKGRRDDKRYFGIPYSVTESVNFIQMSAAANKLIIDLGRQFYGRNNGDLCSTWSLMRERGWRSKETLNDALAELRHYGMIVQTQYGGLNRPSLYALSWLKVDKTSRDSEVIAGQVPGNWKLESPKFVRPSTLSRKKTQERIAGHARTDNGAMREKLKAIG